MNEADKAFVRAAIEKHAERIPESGCWIWTRSTAGKGYGQITLPGRRQRYAHRSSYQAFIGDIPGDMFVCHRCDVPACCNPAHLFIGTPGENSRDAVNKGLWRPGRVGGKRKVSGEQVEQIVAMRERGMLQKDIGALFGITQVRVSQLTR